MPDPAPPFSQIELTAKMANIDLQPPPPPPPPPPAASTSSRVLLLGKYELGDLLGHGAFAKVYKAQNIKTQEIVAIKIIDKEKILKRGQTVQIKREIAILRRVRHPNIVRLFEVMATKTKIFFVMEYVKGGELFNKVSKGRLKEDTARKYFQQLISAVAFCHHRGVYHRDLKPENLLLDENGDLKVSDFGLSCVSEGTRQDGLFHTFCGTPAYVAPEVLAGKGYDAGKADIWSCGVILFVLMAGYLPFRDYNLISMYRKIYKGEFRCPRWFSPPMTRLLDKLLRTNPQTRITIPELMKHKWFRKGFKHVKFYFDGDKMCNIEEEEEDSDNSSSSSETEDVVTKKRKPAAAARVIGNLPRPMSLNAFDIISFSSSFDLSGLFEDRGEGERFVSGEPVSKIISKLEEIAKVVRFAVRKNDCKVCMEGSSSKIGGKGMPLTIAAEIFELTPELRMVEVKNKGGDKGEFDEFYERELKPGLMTLNVKQQESDQFKRLHLHVDDSLLPSDTES